LREPRELWPTRSLRNHTITIILELKPKIFKSRIIKMRVDKTIQEAGLLKEMPGKEARKEGLKNIE
jgi:hypothetical protein